MIAPSSLTSLAHPDRPAAPLARLPRPRRRGPIDPAADVAIRHARARDSATLRELEQLDGRVLSCGTRLLAELGGVAVAAIAVADDTVVADPFARTTAVVDLLRVRARQLRLAA